jgi:hypothetical protein
MIKVDWLAARVLLRVDGATLVIFLCCWRTVCKFRQPMGSKRDWQKKSINTGVHMKPGHIDKMVHAAHIFKPTSLRPELGKIHQLLYYFGET